MHSPLARRRVVALAALLTAACFPDLSGAPCESDLNCPSNQRCEAAACVVGMRGARGVTLGLSGTVDAALASVGQSLTVRFTVENSGTIPLEDVAPSTLRI